MIPESPKYLYERRFFHELRKNIDLFARINKVKMDENYLIDIEEEEENKNNNRQSKSPIYSINLDTVLSEDNSNDKLEKLNETKEVNNKLEYSV